MIWAPAMLIKEIFLMLSAAPPSFPARVPQQKPPRHALAPTAHIDDGTAFRFIDGRRYFPIYLPRHIAQQMKPGSKMTF